MKNLFSSVLAFIAFLGFSVAYETGINATAVTGDMYVLAYSWQPEFCYGYTTQYPGCAQPQTYWKTHFTLHGLWPQYSTGGYPSTCTTEAFDSSVPNKVGWSTMTQYWPDVKYAESDPNYDEFWDHEWTKHGTCSGLTQLDYFNSAINLIKKYGTPSSVTAAVGSTISASSLRTDFGGATKVALQCTSGKYLNGAYTCWSRNTNGTPNAQITCPADVQKEDTCTSSTLTVQSF